MDGQRRQSSRTRRPLFILILLVVGAYLYSVSTGQVENVASVRPPANGDCETPYAEQLDTWRSTLFSRAIALQTQTERNRSAADRERLKSNLIVQPEKHRRFDLFDPFIPCPKKEKLDRYGSGGDGGKLLCPSIMKAPECVVYSLGSHGNFDFEEDILKRTNCKIVTFDCTSPVKVLDPARHAFVRKCLGSKEKMKANSKDWITLEAAMDELNHDHISLLKIDIEGSEFDVFATWEIATAKLPKQIAMELHYKVLYFGTPSSMKADDFSNLFWPPHTVTLSELALFMGHLANLGYGIASREDNPVCPHCTELTLVQVYRC